MRRAACGTALAIACVMLIEGCVTRSITVRSEPPGAGAYLDDERIGETPVTVPFRHYGTRRIRVEKQGFQTESRLVEMNPPWYQVIVLDLICEVLIPYKFHDKRVYSFELRKAVEDKKGFLERARKERAQLR